MDNHTGTSGARSAPGQKKHRRKSRSTQQKQKFIVLPAIEATEPAETGKADRKSTKKMSGPKKTRAAKKTKARSIDGPSQNRTKAERDVPPQDAAAPKDSRGTSHATAPGDFLPEYRSQTDGLRELLSSIDPHDHAYHHNPHSPPQPGLYESPHNETAMHIPHSAPGLPGSPDLPIGPTRWGLYLSGAMGAVAILFVSALVFSHITSPTGINWAKVQLKTGETYQWLAAGLSEQPANRGPANRTAAKAPSVSINDLLEDIATSNETVIATASRISTTAATPRKGSIKTPSAADIFVSPQELENQIRALEGASGKSRNRKSAALKLKTKTDQLPKTPKAARQKPAAFQQLVVIPAANIDPDMESQIFSRARSYLKQRDISSARMILQYAASLGSGISAMALAETFDPNYIKKVNLNGISGSEADARKWYDMAARLGIKEANARLTALK